MVCCQMMLFYLRMLLCTCQVSCETFQQVNGAAVLTISLHRFNYSAIKRRPFQALRYMDSKYIITPLFVYYWHS